MERAMIKKKLFHSMGCYPRCLLSRIIHKKYSSGTKATSIDMEAGYDPELVQKGKYDWWQSKGYFKPNKKKKVTSMILPPPNLTGTLHLGHALTITIQDIYMRWMRMKGENVLWIPGFDHAGIATELMFESHIKKVSNVTKHELGKEEFLKRISEWIKMKEVAISEQMKLLGASVDWSEKYFTMDQVSSNVVTEAFIYLFNKGLIVRRLEPVKWCYSLKSTVSDSETIKKVVDKPCNITVPGYDKPIEFGYMHRIALKTWDNSKEDGEIEICTTRPETILGDTGIAVNPKDERYSHLRGKFVWNPFRKCKIPIVFDESVEPEVGSGAVKVTPAHSLIDFEIAGRHDLELVEIFDENGSIKKTEHYSGAEGMKIFDAREKILDELENLGLYRGKQEKRSEITFCIRTGDIIECILKPQWILKCGNMYDKIWEAISKGDVVLEPEFYKNVIGELFRGRKDWNLSRQIWLGHRIPMYDCRGGGKREWIPGKSPEEARRLASEKFDVPEKEIGVIQEEDVLDTWFSSALLPLTLSGWPKLTDSRYPFGLVETGGDIVFFWVGRMLMLGEEITGEIPFRKILLHGMVCDSYARKMSKSLGNVILPEDVIKGISLDELKAKSERNAETGTLSPEELKLSISEQKRMFPKGIPQCGADALRLSLCNGNFRDEKLYFDINLCQSDRFFCNKIWQILRYFSINVEKGPPLSARIVDENLSVFDRWILSNLAGTVKSMDEEISQFQHHRAVTSLKMFILQKFSDVYLESTKMVFDNDSVEEKKAALSVFFNCFETWTRLVSPFMPFLSEQIYHGLPKAEGFVPSESVTVSKYPEFNIWEKYVNPENEKLMDNFLHILHAVRGVYSLYKLAGQKLKVVLACPSESEELFSHKTGRFFKRHAKVDEFSRLEGTAPERNVIPINVKDWTVYIHHQHSKEALQVMFRSMLGKEEKLKEQLEGLKSGKKNQKKESNVTSTSMSRLSEKLEKIKQVREVIEKAR